MLAVLIAVRADESTSVISAISCASLPLPDDSA